MSLKPPPPTEEQLWALVRVYHGYATDSEMVECIGYGLELHVEKMRQAYCAAFGIAESTH